MTLIVVMNIVFCAFVVIGICSLLGWSIHRSRQVRIAVATTRRERAPRAQRASAPQLYPFPN